jgi:hypothetical protein
MVLKIFNPVHAYILWVCHTEAVEGDFSLIFEVIFISQITCRLGKNNLPTCICALNTHHPRQSVVHIREVDYFVLPRLGV